MSEEIYRVYGENGKDFTVTRFSRGTGRGVGYQLTLGDQTTSIALKDVALLGARLLRESGERVSVIMKQLDVIRGRK